MTRFTTRLFAPKSTLGASAALMGLLAACAGRPAVDGHSTSPLGTEADHGGDAMEEMAHSAPADDVGDGEAYGGEAADADVSGAEAAAAPAEQLEARRSSRPRGKALETEDEAVATARRERPGLGTTFGEAHQSHVVSTTFARGTPAQPDVVISMRYDDARGVEQMGRYTGSTTWSSSRSATARDTFVVKLVDEHGNVMPAAWINDQPFAVGEAGQRYSIGIENNSPYRYEVVGSVDGLDVIDGETAGFHKRGYVLDPYTSMMIDGWRTSDDTVAAFRFGAIADSYAERKGKGRNVGVIGVAFFHEAGAMPWAELQRRASADPFPQRYASPPPPR